mmetsp:Transcript_133302/g.285016  ORF Transcript_133302/g.285016 Transcript_133302/m.285016 type:complete len:611 (+) Transcript_133302:421-2253(+)
MRTILQHDTADALTDQVAVRRCIECEATPASRIHVRLRAADQTLHGREDQVGAHTDKELHWVVRALKHHQLHAVRRRERRGASRVAHKVRALHVENEAEAVRNDGQDRAGAAQSAADRNVLRHSAPVQLIVAHSEACVCGLAVHDLLREADLGQALSSSLQDEALHRVHARRLGIRDLEVLVVEKLGTLDDTTVLASALPRLQVVGVGRPVRVHIPALEGDLLNRVEGGRETRQVRPLVVETSWNASHAVDDVQLVVTRWRGRPIPSVVEPLRLALHVSEGHEGRGGEEVCHQHKRLLCAAATVVIDVGPEEQDRVRSARNREVALELGDALGLGSLPRIQVHRGRARTAEVHRPHERAPPRPEEGAQGSIVRLREGVLGLLIVSERQGDQSGRALVDVLSAEEVHGEGLEDLCEVGQVPVIADQILVLGQALLIVVEPRDLALAIASEVALLDLLGQPRKISLLAHRPKHLDGPLHLLCALADLQDAEALLQEASRDLRAESLGISLRRHEHVEACLIPSFSGLLGVHRFHILGLKKASSTAHQVHKELVRRTVVAHDLAQLAVHVLPKRLDLRIGKVANLYETSCADTADQCQVSRHCGASPAAAQPG